MNLTTIDVYDNQKHILSSDVLNGRVNVLEPPSIDIMFKMQERVSIKNKTTEYRNAIPDEEPNMLAKVYFSAENIQIIQNGLRAGVYKLSNNTHIISPQNVDVLKVIMKSIYTQYAEHKPDVKSEVAYLNSLVLDYAIPNVYNGVLGYIKYTEDISTLVSPMPLPRSVDRDYKQLGSKHWV
jgi:hypothetical protein